MNHLIEKAKLIQCLICDVDGVLTDGSVYIDNHANELKSFNIQDGFGLKLLMSVDIHVAIITGSQNAVIDHRMQQLGIKHYIKGQLNKNNAYQSLKTTLNLSDEQFAYIGDDLPDLTVMKQVGLSIAVSNALPEVKQQADFHTELHGGRGAVREICDFILRAKGIHERAVSCYLG